MAWNLSSLDEYTCWALLVALAFYDLCAVLTPCGPLKALVGGLTIITTTTHYCYWYYYLWSGLMHEKKEPLPGLLYEASIQNTRRNNSSS
jgi:presenilin 1